MSRRRGELDAKGSAPLPNWAHARRSAMKSDNNPKWTTNAQTSSGASVPPQYVWTDAFGAKITADGSRVFPNSHE
jgi:hypothetical protein